MRFGFGGDRAGPSTGREVAATRGEHKARHFVAGDHVGVAWPVRGQSVLADERTGPGRASTVRRLKNPVEVPEYLRVSEELYGQRG